RRAGETEQVVVLRRLPSESESENGTRLSVAGRDAGGLFRASAELHREVDVSVEHGEQADRVLFEIYATVPRPKWQRDHALWEYGQIRRARRRIQTGAAGRTDVPPGVQRPPWPSWVSRRLLCEARRGPADEHRPSDEYQRRSDPRAG